MSAGRIREHVFLPPPKLRPMIVIAMCSMPIQEAILAVFFAGLISGTAASKQSKQERAEQIDTFFTNRVVPRFSVQVQQESMAALRNHFRSYVTATVTEGTNVYRDVGIHLKGQYGTFQGIDGRPSLTLNLDKYIRGQLFHGLGKLHLNNSAQDPSYLCEIIGRELFQAAGVPTARARHARVELNGRDLGLYVLTEGYDKRFLKCHFANSSGNLYDSGFDPADKTWMSTRSGARAAAMICWRLSTEPCAWT